jgi:DMSO/TMAO reductase YedYZ molybdopterin-dependent catalytic subunit
MQNNSNINKNQRLPPGQHITKRLPVLQKGRIAHINREKYELKIEGEIENPRTFSLEELKELVDREIVADIHCVTSWSKFDTKWSGISFRKIFSIVKPKNTAHFIEFYCADKEFTTTVPIEKLQVDNTLLALIYDGLPISDKHGGPVRVIIPNLYFYKSAKWLIKITFLEKDKLGYWERRGYSNKADPWKEQRYSSDD